MKFKGQGKINICGFEYKKNIADSRRGGGFPSTPKPPISAPAARIVVVEDLIILPIISSLWLYKIVVVDDYYDHSNNGGADKESDTVHPLVKSLNSSHGWPIKSGIFLVRA